MGAQRTGTGKARALVVVCDGLARAWRGLPLSPQGIRAIARGTTPYSAGSLALLHAQDKSAFGRPRGLRNKSRLVVAMLRRWGRQRLGC